MTTRSYGQYCPVARSLDLLGERWTLLIVRDLLTGPRRFVDLRDGLPGLGANLLSARLRHLEARGLARRRTLPPPAARVVYELTERGRELDTLVVELARFGLAELDQPAPDAPPPEAQLPTALRALVRTERLPDHELTVLLRLDGATAVLHIDAPATGPDRSWARVRVTLPEADSTEPPDPDLEVRGPMTVLLRLRQGHLARDDAIGRGLDVDGPAAAVESFWSLLLPDAPRPAA